MPERGINLQGVNLDMVRRLISDYSYSREMAMARVISDLVRAASDDCSIEQFALDLKAFARQNDDAKALWNKINRELEAGFKGHTNGLSNKQFILDTLGNIHSPSRHAGL